MATTKKRQVKKAKVYIVQDTAEELESLIGDYLHDWGPGRKVPHRDIQDLLHSVGCPTEVLNTIISRLRNLAEDINALKNGDVVRMYIDGVSEELKSLEEYLARKFEVVGTRRNRKYVWEVWG